MALDLSKAEVRYSKIGDMDRSFDYEFWRRQTFETKMSAIWEMTVFQAALKGKDASQLRIDRTVGGVRKIQGQVFGHRRLRRRAPR
jgi:hypothetical protein